MRTGETLKAEWDERARPIMVKTATHELNSPRLWLT